MERRSTSSHTKKTALLYLTLFYGSIYRILQQAEDKKMIRGQAMYRFAVDIQVREFSVAAHEKHGKSQAYYQSMI